MVSRVIPVEDFDLVIFGGTGDLARRKYSLASIAALLMSKCPKPRASLGPHART